MEKQEAAKKKYFIMWRRTTEESRTIETELDLDTLTEQEIAELADKEEYGSFLNDAEVEYVDHQESY